jgi:hypothetical protein
MIMVADEGKILKRILKHGDWGRRWGGGELWIGYTRIWLRTGKIGRSYVQGSETFGFKKCGKFLE